MNVRCDRCRKTYRVDASRAAGRERVKVKCPSCGSVLDVRVEPSETAPPAGTPAPPAPARPAPQSTAQRPREVEFLSAPGKIRAGVLALPDDRRISLAVLSGPDQGNIIPVDRPRLVIGRAEADVVLSDTEVSRQHAVLEVYGDKFLVRDLNSTNGTFIGDRKITAEEIANHSEFRIGGSRVMLIVTNPEE